MNLQIGRTASRMPEMAVRSALGAGFGRLLQQLVTENVLVSLLGAALGGGLAFIAVAAVRHVYANKYPRFDELSVHPLVMCAACVLAVLVGIFASLAPAKNVRRQTGGVWQSRSTTRKSRLPGLLVAAQVALTCVLLVTSGLFVRTLRSLENVNSDSIRAASQRWCSCPRIRAGPAAFAARWKRGCCTGSKACLAFNR